ncbi:hypothetical protein Taro_051030 [Colocasia esculenta]|uniref:Uncharacterized protein n=1 Tax=Colocasia esculenta TaxID=4460 RepID=A0A843XEX2_COLES|nr:hypothetical protein [Colocasia esculenta]
MRIMRGAGWVLKWNKTCCSSVGVGGQYLWTFRVVVAIGGRGVDANLRILQVLKGAWRTVGRVAFLNCVRKRRTVVQFPWELTEGSA